MFDNITVQEVVRWKYPKVPHIIRGSSYEKIEWNLKNEFVTPSKEEFSVIEDEYRAFKVEMRALSLKEKLIAVCDERQSSVLRLFLKEKASDGQQKRYQRKYERAKRGDFSPEENTAIIQKHEFVLSQIDNFVDMIETARQYITDNVIDAGEYERAEQLIHAASQLDATTTPESLKTMLSGVTA